MHRKTPVSMLLLFGLIISSLTGCDLIPQFSSSDTEPTVDIAAVHTGVAQEMMMKLTAEAMAATSLAVENPVEPTPEVVVPTATQEQATATAAVVLPSATSAPAAAVEQSAVSNQGSGLGKTRSEVILLYKLLAFEFEMTSDVQGQEVYTGTVSDNLAVVKITGPADNITGVSVDMNIPQPADDNDAARTLIYLSSVLSAGLEEWTEGPQWMAQSLSTMGESRTTVNGREVVMNVAQDAAMTRISFSISS